MTDRAWRPGQLEAIARCREALAGSLTGTGVSAAYLWGSVTRSDFVPGRSDLDCLLVGEEGAQEEVSRYFADKVDREFPGLPTLDFSLVYRSELSGGKLRSRLARRIHPRVLLSSAGSWILAAGEGLVLDPHSQTCPNEILALRLDSLARRLRDHFRDPEDEEARYVFKEVFFLLRLLATPSLHFPSPGAVIAITATTLRLQARGWEETACRHALPEAISFLATVRQEISSEVSPPLHTVP